MRHMTRVQKMSHVTRATSYVTHSKIIRKKNCCVIRAKMSHVTHHFFENVTYAQEMSYVARAKISHVTHAYGCAYAHACSRAHMRTSIMLLAALVRDCLHRNASFTQVSLKYKFSCLHVYMYSYLQMVKMVTVAVEMCMRFCL